MNRDNVHVPPQIEYHADDFGLFPEQSRRILECHSSGCLNGVSVFPNSPHLNHCMEMLHPVLHKVAVTVHLNFIEGSCMTRPMKGITDENGILQLSFGAMLLRSFLPGKKEYYLWLKEEIRCQILTVARLLPKETPLRLDGHAHYHMLPLIFDALMAVIQEEKLQVRYIRIPREYPSLYLRHVGELKDFSPINVVKVLILNLLAARNCRKYATYLDTLEQKLFLGVFLSGRMYKENVEPLLPDAMALAQHLGWDLELLAHPGGVYEEQDIDQITSHEDVEFLTSPMRRQEATLFHLQ